jgi:hypothetical protein
VLEELEEANPLFADQVIHRKALQVEFQKILDEEELYWYKRSHETWLLKGDNNTNFFHRVSNGRRRKQTIYALYEGDK